MDIDTIARWLSRVALVAAVVIVFWGASVDLTQPVTTWFAASSAIGMALLVISAIWQLRGSFPALAALALSTAVVSRLFSVLQLQPPIGQRSAPGLKLDQRRACLLAIQLRSDRANRSWIWLGRSLFDRRCGRH